VRGRLAVLAVAAALAAAGPAPAQELAGHGGPVRALAATADGGRLLSGSFDTSLILWQPTSGAALGRLQGHAGAVNALALADDGGLALSGGEDGRAILWNLPGGTARWLVALEAKVQAVALDSVAGLAAAGTGDGRVHLLALGDGRPLARLELGRERPTALLFLPGPGGLVAAGHLGGLWMIEPEAGTARELAGPTGFALTDLALGPDGLLATGSIDGLVRLRRLPGLEPVAELVGHEAPVLALAFAPDRDRLASGDIKGRIVLWSLAGRSAERVLEPHAGPVWDLAFTGPPATLWSAGGDAIVRRWVEGEPAPAALAAAAPRQPVESERGARLFRACAACHTVTADGGNRAGPSLYGLFGRPAASVRGYGYSEALVRSGIVWSEETVDRLFALGPETLTPGSKMPLQRMPDPVDRAALIAYLKRVTRPAGPGPESGG
jgi:cytochrome c